MSAQRGFGFCLTVQMHCVAMLIVEGMTQNKQTRAQMLKQVNKAANIKLITIRQSIVSAQQGFGFCLTVGTHGPCHGRNIMTKSQTNKQTNTLTHKHTNKHETK